MNTLLLLLLDTRAPAGAHHHSGGMEAAVSTGLVAGLSDLETFCQTRLRTSARVAAAFAAAACHLQANFPERAPLPARGTDRAPRADATPRTPRTPPTPWTRPSLPDPWPPPDPWAELDAEFDARTPSEAMRAASRQLGGGLLRLLRSLQPDAALPWTRGGTSPHHPLVLGAAISLADGSPELAARAAALAACAARPAPRSGCSAWTRSRSRPCWPGWRPASTSAPAAPPTRALLRRFRPTAPRPWTCWPTSISPRRCVCLRPDMRPSHGAHDHGSAPHDHGAPDHAPADGPPGARVPRIGIGGPVGSGKTALVAALCRALSDELVIGVVTNDIYTTEDADFLRRAGVLPDARIRAVQTGACPHTAIRDDISANLDAVEQLEADHPGLELVLVESGGDNLTATFSYGLIHRQIFVIDVAGGDKVPRKGGPGITRSDLLVINKTDLAPLVGADLSVMARDATAVRGQRPTVFTSLVADPVATEVAEWVRAVRSAVATARTP